MEKKLSYKVPTLRLLGMNYEENFLNSLTGGGIDDWTEDGDAINF